MNRSYRFVRLDAAMRPIGEELTLICPTAGDALLVGGTLGWLVEVWDGRHRVGLAGSGVSQRAAPAPEAPGEIAPPPAPAAPAAEPGAFNPFRPGDWSRAR